MSANRTKQFKLTTPIVGHGETFEYAEFNEPKFHHFMSFGQPFIVQDGNFLPVMGVVDAYLQKLIVKPADYLIFSSQADMKVALEASTWLLNFFLSGDKAKEDGPKSPTI